MAELPRLYGKSIDVPRQIAEAALKELIDKKHLYQFLRVNFTNAVLFSAIEQSARQRREDENGKTADESVVELCAEMALYPWYFRDTDRPFRIRISMPPVATWCAVCKDVEAFGLRQSEEAIRTYDGWEPGEQVFCVELLCQRCKAHVVVFSIKKTRDKLQIVGRSEFEYVPVPEFIPKAQRAFYSQAVIAFHAGHYMAAACVLRVTIEQFMRAVVKNSNKMKADELCDAYMKTLPNDFNSRFPSLKDIYGKLSEASHKGEASDELFEKQRRISTNTSRRCSSTNSISLEANGGTSCLRNSSKRFGNTLLCSRCSRSSVDISTIGGG